MELEFYRGYTIEIEQCVHLDESTREWDNLGTMVAFHKRYNLGDEHNYHNPSEWISEMLGEYTIIQAQDEALQKIEEDYIILPLYLYDHSGLVMSTASFVGRAQHATWDSGQVGFIYVSKDKVREEYGWKYITKPRVEKIKESLAQEVKTYSDYLGGFVYGFTIRDSDGNYLDSTCGYYGLDYEASGLMDMARNDIDWIIKKNKEANKLMEEALKSCEWREHIMSDFEQPDTRSSRWVAECEVCGKTVTVSPNPMPNQTNIMGEAVAVGCVLQEV